MAAARGRNRPWRLVTRGSIVSAPWRFPQGAPPSDLLYRILELLVSEREAGLIARLPIRPFDVPTAARIWGMRESEARAALDALAGRAVLLDMDTPEGRRYVLPPPMAGFFEFSMMRVRDDVDQHLLGELFSRYITEEDDFIVALFTNGETQLGRVFVNEPALAARDGLARDGVAPPPACPLRVLDHERASEVIESAAHVGVGLCYCRHKMEHVGRACDAPRDICMTFGGAADMNLAWAEGVVAAWTAGASTWSWPRSRVDAASSSIRRRDGDRSRGMTGVVA